MVGRSYRGAQTGIGRIACKLEAKMMGKDEVEEIMILTGKRARLSWEKKKKNIYIYIYT
jgi:hypothetical protein